MLFVLPITEAESKINMISGLHARYWGEIFCLVFPYILLPMQTLFIISPQKSVHMLSVTWEAERYFQLHTEQLLLHLKWSDFSSILPLTFNHFCFGEATQSCKHIPSCANIFQVHSQWYKHSLHQSSVQIPAHSAIQISVQHNCSPFKKLQDSQPLNFSQSISINIAMLLYFWT